MLYEFQKWTPRATLLNQNNKSSTDIFKITSRKYFENDLKATI